MKPTSMRALLSELPSRLRVQIKDAFAKRGGRPPLTRAVMPILEDAIFQVENELEHKLAATGLAPSHPRMSPVVAMRRARNLLLDATGANECR